jgi:hypothetical protein
LFDYNNESMQNTELLVKSLKKGSEHAAQ